MEEVYIGTKIIMAEPMSEKEFAFGKGMTWEGGKPSRPGYKVRYEDSYVSWSPKETFERAYRKMSLKEAELVAAGQFVVKDESR